MLSYHIFTINDFHWGFKPVLSYFLNIYWRRKVKEKMHLLSLPRPLRIWTKWMESQRKSIQNGKDEKENPKYKSYVCENHHRSPAEGLSL